MPPRTAAEPPALHAPRTAESGAPVLHAAAGSSSESTAVRAAETAGVDDLRHCQRQGHSHCQTDR